MHITCLNCAHIKQRLWKKEIGPTLQNASDIIVYNRAKKGGGDLATARKRTYTA